MKTLHIDNFWNFATFNLYTVRAEILYLQRYSTNFRNPSLSSKRSTLSIWVESFRCAGTLLLQWPGENFAHRQQLKFCHFQPVHCARKIPISLKVFHRFSKSSPQLEHIEGGHLGGKFHVGRYLTFAMARWKLCASTTFEILPLSTCTLCQQKPISPKVFRWFSKYLPQLEDAEGGHLGGKFQLRRYFTFAIARSNFAHRQQLKFCYFQPVQCASKNPISPKIFNQLSKIFASARRCWGWALEWKVSGAQVFYFCNGKVKICASTTFEVLLLSTCTLCQQNSYICKGIQPIFEIFPSTRRCWGCAFGWKVSGAQVFYFCNGQGGKLWRIDNIWSFATLNLYTVPAKILYLQWYSTDFWNLSLSSKMFREGIWCGKFQVRRNFTFAMARWKLCASTTFEIMLFSTCRLCKQKSYISKGIQPIFEIFPSTRRCWGCAFGWKVSGAQVFYFCNGKVKTLRIDNIWSFATLNLYTVPAKILYLQWYSTDFWNLSLSSKMFREGICVVSFRCVGILLLQWQGENFARRQPLKFCHFQPVHCAGRNPLISKDIQPIFEIFPHLEDVDDGHLGGKFQVRGNFTFAMARWKLCASTTFEIFPLSTSTLCQQKSYNPKDVQPIFENLSLGAKMLTMAIWVESFRCAGILLLQWPRLKTLRLGNIWNFATFNLYTLPAKILYLQWYSTGFWNLSLSSKMFREGICVVSFRCVGILLLQWQGENFARRQHLKLCYFQPVHCASRNPISPKVFNRFSKSFRQLEDVEGVHWLESFRCAGILLLQWQGENFAHRQHLKFCYSQPVHCASKNPISSWYSTDFWILASARRCLGRAFVW